MPILPSPGTTDLAGQIAIVQGVDSNVFQTQSADGTITRHPAAFTSIEGSLGFFAMGRVPGDVHGLRAFGRLLAYEPLGPSFQSRNARGGLSYQGSLRLDRRTTLVTTLLGSVGSLQAARGTDAAFVAVDPVSTRRSAWNASGSETFVVETSRTTTMRVLAGVDVAGTIAETAPSTGATVRRGLDYLVGRFRFSTTERLDRRTSLEGAVLVERFHSAYVLPSADPAAPPAAPIDGGHATATVGLSRALARGTTGTGALGVAVAIPAFGQPVIAQPVASAALLHAEERWSASALATFQYALAQSRVGPGQTGILSLVYVGKPLSGPSRNALDVIAEGSAQRTGVLVGPNDGSSVTSGGGSLTFRWAPFASGAAPSGLGLLAGYDVRASRFVAAADGGTSPWYVRHLGFVGLSYAWAGAGSVSPLPTLARPAVVPFTP